MNNENKNDLFNIREIIYLIYNGMATGGVVNQTKLIINDGFDRDKFIILLMWLMCFGLSAQRLYEIYKTRKENQENQNNQHHR